MELGICPFSCGEEQQKIFFFFGFVSVLFKAEHLIVV
jgi:hypothetical protein